MRITALVLAALLLAACGGAPKSEEAAPAAAPAPKPKPADQSKLFPIKDRLEVTQSAEPLYGKAYLGPGNIARYKSGAKPYEMFVVESVNPEGAAFMLLAAKKHLQDPKVIAHFGGFYGTDDGVPMFLFAKGNWFAGVRGLPEKQADAVARDFAALIR